MAKQYNVGCIDCGKVVMVVGPGHELYEKCREREAAGYLDALLINHEECPVCQEMMAIQQAQTDRYGTMIEPCYGD